MVKACCDGIEIEGSEEVLLNLLRKAGETGKTLPDLLAEEGTPAGVAVRELKPHERK
ncbi:MAG TPA: hypothetical protein VD967_00320 [Candidatus Paceibacterota bacterium]|nr:hypothetical protein [Candidatus Paceibacterota bacterium]